MNYLFIPISVLMLLLSEPEKALYKSFTNQNNENLSFKGNVQSSPVIKEDAELKKLAESFEFTEGPVSDQKGNVYFTDQPNNKIYIWTINNELKTFTSNAGRANGLYFDNNGDLLACADKSNQLWRFNPGSETDHEILIKDFKGDLLNGPNDLWVHPNGNVYFTDPLYKRDYWTRDPEMQVPGEYVYLYNPQTENLTPVATNLEKPNGIIGTKDGKWLYVADIEADKTWSYTINKDGSLANKQLFTSSGSDGMTMDSKGNLYLTGKEGVTIFNGNGKQIEQIPIDKNWTANVCFGGENGRKLFITAMDALYAIDMKYGKP